MPPIPAALANEVRRYTESRSASFQDWHPTRREVLVATRFGNVAQVHRVAQPLGARAQLTFFDEPVGGAVYDPRGGESFLFLKDVGGNEFDQIYRYALADGRVTLLTDGAARRTARRCGAAPATASPSAAPRATARTATCG